MLSVRRRTLNDWVSDIKQKHKASRDAIIVRLDLLGWTHKDIGAVVDLSEARVDQISLVLAKSPKLGKSLTGLTDMGKSIDEASKALEIDTPLAWGLLLQDCDDMEKLKMLEEKNKGLSCSPRPYDIWNFSSSYRLFGREGYPGQIPGQIVLQLLYFFTKQGDMVVDPMAGGGTTIDACLVMGSYF